MEKHNTNKGGVREDGNTGFEQVMKQDYEKIKKSNEKKNKEQITKTADTYFDGE